MKSCYVREIENLLLIPGFILQYFCIIKALLFLFSPPILHGANAQRVMELMLGRYWAILMAPLCFLYGLPISSAGCWMLIVWPQVCSLTPNTLHVPTQSSDAKTTS